jgi:hypothetical protein
MAGVKRGGKEAGVPPAVVHRRIAAVVADGAMPSTPLDGVARIMAAILIVIVIVIVRDVVFQMEHGPDGFPVKFY